jgi:hypothetical protein
MPVTKTEVKSFKKHPAVKKSASRLLYKTAHLRLIDRTSFMEINCLDEAPLEKKEFVSFLRHTKKFFKESFKNKILVTLSNGLNFDVEAWSLIVKMEFEDINFKKIGFVTRTMQQSLLLKYLEQLSFNVRIFSEKNSAIEWLNQDLLTE